ncbi:MAG: enamine deaminase RidA (YjgF/YER057c/UK114 family) [Gammaproteobacteria bacterium]|jgi:enamine deaminase RidA (YjgF/YER057c/UK114 family)
MLQKEFINPHPMGFTNVVVCSSSGVKTIYISGQVGYADGKVGESFTEQADMVYRNLIKELLAAGANAEDVVKINTYVVDLNRDKSKIMRTTKDRYFTQENQPASTMVGVSALVMEELLVEVEATAVISE